MSWQPALDPKPGDTFACKRNDTVNGLPAEFGSCQLDTGRIGDKGVFHVTNLERYVTETDGARFFLRRPWHPPS